MPGMEHAITKTVLLAIVLAPLSARAFVASPVGGHPGAVDVGVRVGFEPGKLEPNEYEGSWPKARGPVDPNGGGGPWRSSR